MQAAAAAERDVAPLSASPVLAALVLLQVHRGWAWFVIIGNGLAGLWALGAHWWPPLRTRALWWFTIVAELSIFVQAGLGVALVNVEKIDPPQFHLFYGFVAIITVGLLVLVQDDVAVGARPHLPRVRPRQPVPHGPRDPRLPRRRPLTPRMLVHGLWPETEVRAGRGARPGR